MKLPLTPIDFLRRAVAFFGRKEAVVDGAVRLSYAELGERAWRLASALGAAGAEPGDRVATLALNSHELLEAYFGVPAAGAVLLPLNVRLGAAELARVVAHAAPRWLLVDPELAELLAAVAPHLSAPPEVVWLGEPPGRVGAASYEQWLRHAPSASPPAGPRDEDAVAEIFYTSGTTGSPRGVMLTHRNLYLHALGVLIAMGGSERDVQLHSIALYHANGWGAPQALTAVGARQVMLRRFDPAEALGLIEREHVTRMCLVPTMLAMLLAELERQRRDVSSLELVNTGGAATAPALLQRAEALLGCRVVGGYGLTETSPLITYAGDKSHLSEDEPTRLGRRASTGLPVLGAELAIVDEQGDALPWDGEAVGEIAVRSNLVMAGYYRDPEATAAALEQGWLRTGDLARVDEEGYFQIVDRKKDIIVSGGENVASIEVEAVLYQHPAVRECAVVGAPDPRWGEAVVAFVAVEPDVGADAAALEAWCRARLAAFQVPKRFELLDELPKGGTGKILKRALRQRLAKR